MDPRWPAELQSSIPTPHKRQECGERYQAPQALLTELIKVRGLTSIMHRRSIGGICAHYQLIEDQVLGNDCP